MATQQIQGQRPEANAGMEKSAKQVDHDFKEGVMSLRQALEAAAVSLGKMRAALARAGEGGLSDGRQIDTAKQRPETSRGSDGDREHADENAAGGAQKIPLHGQRDDQEHRQDIPLARQFSGQSAGGVACALGPAGQVEAWEKPRPAQLGNSQPEGEPPEPAAGGRSRMEPRRAEDLQRTASLPRVPAEIPRAAARTEWEEHNRRVLERQRVHHEKLDETLGRLTAETHRHQQQTIAVVESIVAGQAVFLRRLEQLEGQHAAMRNTQGGQG